MIMTPPQHPESKQKIASLQRALGMSRLLGDQLREIDCLDQLGDIYLELGYKRLAIQHHEQAVQLSEALKDEGRIIRGLFSLGHAFNHFREYDKSIDCHEQLLELVRKSKIVPYMAAGCLRAIGAAYFYQGDLEEAVHYYKKAVKEARSGENDHITAQILAELANCYYMQEQTALAGHFMPNLRHQSYYRLGNRDVVMKAQSYFLEAWLLYYHDKGPPVERGFICNRLGDTQLKLKEYEEAVMFYKEAISIYEAYEDRQEEQHSWRGYGHAFFLMGDQKTYLDAAQKSTKIQQEGNSVHYGLEQRRIWISDDGQIVTAVFPDGRLQQWQMPGGQLLNTIQAGDIETVTIGRDGRLAAVYQNKTVTVLQLPEETIQQTIQTPHEVQNIYFWEDGSVLVTANWYQYAPNQSPYFPFVQFWNIETGELIDSVELPLPHINVLFTYFLPAENWREIMIGLVYPSHSTWDRIRLYVCPLNQEHPISNGGYNFLTKYNDSNLTAQEFNQAASFLALGWISNLDTVQAYKKTVSPFAIHLWRRVRHFPVTPLSILTWPLKLLLAPLLIFLMRDLSFFVPDFMAPRRKTSRFSTVLAYLTRLFTGRMEFRKGKWLNGHMDRINWLAITADSQLLISGSGDYTIRLWHLPNGKFIKELAEHGGPVTQGVLHPDSHLLATADALGHLIIWDLPQGNALHHIQAHNHPVTSLTANAGGQYLATTGSPYAPPKLWDWTTGFHPLQ